MRNHGRPTFDQILFDQLTSYRKVNFRRNYCSVYDIHVVPLIIKPGPVRDRIFVFDKNWSCDVIGDGFQSDL